MKTKLSFLTAMLIALFASVPYAGAEDFAPRDVHERIWNGDFAPQSPENIAMLRYAEATPNYFNGQVNFSIPLYEWKDNMFDIPVSLVYSYSGFKPGFNESSCGLGWSLNAGGIITREVRGIPDESGDMSYGASSFLFQRSHDESYSDGGNDNPSILDNTHLPNDNPYNGYSIRGFLWAYGGGEYLQDDALFLYTGQLANDFTCGYEIPDMINSAHNKCMEGEPDIFHFSFPGASGSFIFQPNWEVLFLESSVPAGELKVTFASAIGDNGSEFRIETGDGTIYEFGAQEYSKSFDSVSGSDSGSESDTYSAWKLSAIRHPSGKTVNFMYDDHTVTNYSAGKSRDRMEVGYHDQSSPVAFSPIRNWQNPESYSEDNLGVNQVFTKRLREISVNGRGSMIFSYNNEDMLVSFKARNVGGRTLKKVNLSYVAPRRTSTAFCRVLRFLKDVSIDGGGRYTFTYDGETAGIFPEGDNTSELFKTDWYGYYNNHSYSGYFNDSNIGVYTLAQRVLETRHRYDLPRTRMGAMTKVVYPTGFYRTFAYELNGYNRVVDNTALTQSETVTGGIRVKSIGTYNSDDTPVEYRNVIYSDGVLLQPVTLGDIYYCYSIVNECYDLNMEVNREACSPNLTFGYSKDYHVEYRTVTERIATDSLSTPYRSIEHRFHSSSVQIESGIETEYLSESSNFEEQRAGVFSINIDTYSGHSPSESHFHGVKAEQGREYRTVSTSLDGSGPGVTSQTTYSNYGQTGYSGITMVFGHMFNRHYNSCPIHVTHTETTITEQGGRGATHTYHDMTYDDLGRVIGIENEDYDGGVISTNYTYHDFIPSYITSVSRKKNGVNAMKTEYRYMNVEHHPDWYVPSSVIQSSVQDGEFTGTRTLMTFSSYDAWGNPTTVTGLDGNDRFWGWTPDGLHPTYESIWSNSDDLRQTRLWTWIPMVGMTSATDFNGRSLYYDYDAAGRLTEVSNEDGTLERYEYNFVTDPLALSPSFSSDYNYIAKTTCFDAGRQCKDITYYDALGRDMQSVSLADGNAIVNHRQYLDALHKSFSYVPYASSLRGMFDSGWASHLHGETVYESDMDGRTISETLPGSGFEWHPSTMSYMGSGTVSGVFTTDGDGRESAEWKDGQGRVIRTSLGGNVTTYDYDANGNLVRVTQPEGTAFEYAYDEWNRLVSKTIPGGGTTTYAYDTADRVEFSQDGNQAVQGKRIHYLYDSLGRLIGKRLENAGYSSGSTIEEYYYNMDNNGGYMPTIPSRFAFVSEPGVADSAASNENMLVYSKTAVPYDFELSDGGIDLSEHTGVGTQALVPGPTIEANQYLEKAYYYDAVGRIAQTVEDNILGGVSRTSYKYDLAGNVLETVERHTRRNVSGEDVKRTMRSYDGRGNMISESVTLNGVNAYVENTYNSINQLVCSHCGDPEYGFNLNRSYNPLGWLTGITARDYTGAVIFNENLAYESPSFGTPCYSGNISQISWQQHGGSPMSFALGYDNCGRFAESRPQTGNAFSEQNITYDGNGNILSIDRYDDSSSASTSSLSYFYDGNRMESITDNNVSYDFEYDSNGNMTVDGMQGLTIDYNLLNLPTTVSRSGMTATYRYSFDGVKREAKVSSRASSVPAGQPTAYAYLGSLVYTKTGGSYTLESTDFSGGRIVPGDTQHPVHYHITDHLGSVRVVAWPEEGDDAAVILEQNDYYPYGLRMDNGLTASTDNRYRFSGKETQPLMDGSILDFGARYYNPTIARWTTIDPKAEKYYSTTPYSYCTGNPVMYVDPDGRRSIPLLPMFKNWTVKVDSWFGQRNTHLENASKNHKGLDFNYSGGGNTDLGSPILATHEGTATVVDNTQSMAGRHVIITSPDGKFRTEYFHLSEINVLDGQYVWESETIGAMGGSAMGKEDGRTSHLHYQIEEVSPNGSWTAINPVGENTNEMKNIEDPQKRISEDDKVYNGGSIPAAVVVG